mmetsp:Transcript_96810/g.215766  ORF Transcript_96810/g.215766 Transcript_96810/m.215766 type:complete len:315 (-) Transcript_96810:1103-2047(-)
MSLVLCQDLFVQVTLQGHTEAHLLAQLHPPRSLHKGVAEVDAHHLVEARGCELEGGAAYSATHVEGPAPCPWRRQGGQESRHALWEAQRVLRSPGVADDGRGAAGSFRGGGEVQAQVLIKERLGLIDVAVGCCGGVGRRWLGTKGRGVEVLCRCGRGGGHKPEAGVLEEVRPEVVAAEDGGAIVARAYEAAPHDHVVLSIEARRGEVIVDMVHLETVKGIEVVLSPLPGVAHSVVVSRGGWGQRVHGALRGVGQVEVGPTRRRRSEVLAAGPKGAVPHGILAGRRHLGAAVPDEVVLRLRDDAVFLGALHAVLL